jgi:hypothetical protein
MRRVLHFCVLTTLQRWVGFWVRNHRWAEAIV